MRLRTGRFGARRKNAGKKASKKPSRDAKNIRRRHLLKTGSAL